MTTVARVDVGPVPFDATNPRLAVKTLLDLVDSGVGQPVRLVNAYCVAEASHDPIYRNLLRGKGINLPDGTPVAWIMRHRLHDQTVATVRGPGLLPALAAAGRKTGLRHFFLGTTDETLNKMTEKLQAQYPELIVAGTYSPPFAPISEEFIADCVAKVEAAKPQVVWVGLGSPKQDYVAAAIAERTNTVAVGVGAAFDFIAGTVREAPVWLHGTGFEWMFRLAMDPKRLWRRYLFGNTLFLKIAVTQEFRRKQLTATN